ncbi:ABC transporter permease [Desulfurococcaceae archaeon MEX13E-LK6-19]|nr:ABC transporter permease [Desulfurococcaceae archaeon MEX13E-LK6-19]
MSRLGSIKAILWKDLRQYYAKPPTISWGILTPAAIVGVLAIAVSYNWRIIPGLVGLALMFSSSTMAQVCIGIERRFGSFERLLYAPVTLGSIIIAKSLGGIVFGLIGACMSIAIIMVFVKIRIVYMLTFFTAVLLGSIIFSLIGIIAAVVMRIENSMVFMNTLRFLMLFLSGIFIPIYMLPSIVQLVSYALPLTYIVELLRYSMYCRYDLIDPITSLISLVLYTITLTIVTKWIVEKKIYQ